MSSVRSYWDRAQVQLGFASQLVHPRQFHAVAKRRSHRYEAWTTPREFHTRARTAVLSQLPIRLVERNGALGEERK